MSFLMNLDLAEIITGSAAGIILFTSVILFAGYYVKKNKRLTENMAEEKGDEPIYCYCNFIEKFLSSQSKLL